MIASILMLSKIRIVLRYLVIILILIQTSCHTERLNQDSTTQVNLPATISLSEIINSPQKNFNLSSIAENIEYIQLETCKESILGNIQTIVPIDIGYLVVDNTESIFLFDQDGKFIWRINNKGRGPTEYLELSTPIGIDTAENEIIVPDYKELDIYDFAGNYKRKVVLQFKVSGAYVHSSGRYVLWRTSPFESTIAYITDREGKILKQIKNYSQSERLNESGIQKNQATSQVEIYKDGIFLSNKDTIWFLDESLKLIPWFIINSKVKGFDDRYYTFGYDVLNDSIIGLFQFMKKEYYLYNVSTNEVSVIYDGIKDDIDNCSPVNPWSGNGYYLISAIPPSTLINNKSNISKISSLNNIVQLIKEDDNPIIRKIYLR